VAAIEDDDAERLMRVLNVLAMSGGAALIRRDRSEVVATAGFVDPSITIAARFLPIGPVEGVAHLDDSLVADVDDLRRLVARLPPGGTAHAFGARLRRCAMLLSRFVLAPPQGSSSPPSSAPAEAAVFAQRPPGRR
jgi:hypothetical protein